MFFGWGGLLLLLLLMLPLCLGSSHVDAQKSTKKEERKKSKSVSNCNRGKLHQEAFTIQVSVRGLDGLDYFKLITG